MIGNLTDVQINEMLHKGIVGRIGCYANDMVYVVPISYSFDGKSIYAHTYEGLKMQMMHKNPAVCFEVDDFTDMANWKSVIAWGRFEEVDDEEERTFALKILMNRHLPVIASSTTRLSKSWPFYRDEVETIDGLIFRITLTKCTGKFECSSNSLYR